MSRHTPTGTRKKGSPGRPRLSAARLVEMIKQATVDAFGESEQLTGWFTMIDENLVVPFDTEILDIPVTVERITQDDDERIVAVCSRAGKRQTISILDLPLPARLPEGAEWLEAFRRWRRRSPTADVAARLEVDGEENGERVFRPSGPMSDRPFDYVPLFTFKRLDRAPHTATLKYCTSFASGSTEAHMKNARLLMLPL